MSCINDTPPAPSKNTLHHWQQMLTEASTVCGHLFQLISRFQQLDEPSKHSMSLSYHNLH